jgi:hypothetical protein
MHPVGLKINNISSWAITSIAVFSVAVRLSFLLQPTFTESGSNRSYTI